MGSLYVGLARPGTSLTRPRRPRPLPQQQHQPIRRALLAGSTTAAVMAGVAKSFVMELVSTRVYRPLKRVIKQRVLKRVAAADLIDALA